jgi:hypothetical protein
MKRSYAGNKLVMGFLGLFTIGAFAGVVIDRQRHSDAFMDNYRLEIEEIGNARRTQRFVASSDQQQLPRMQYFPVNSENRELINGDWIITRINDQFGEDIYNVFERAEDREREVIVSLDLIATSTVMIEDEEEQIFQISLLTEYNTIALFKRMPNGYELLEARKAVSAPAAVVNTSTATQDRGSDGPVLPAGLRIESDLNLVLERALHPSKSQHMLTGNAVSGEVSLVDGRIQDLRVSLRYENGGRDEVSIEFAEIGDGGQFEAFLDDAAQEAVFGIITNNGEDVYRIRFATGPLQGAMLNFVTDSKFDELADERYEEEDKLEEAQEFSYYRNNTEVIDQEKITQQTFAAQDERAQFQSQDYYGNERYEYEEHRDEDPYGTEAEYEDYYSDDSDNESEDYASIEEINERMPEIGFDFSSSRSVASVNEEASH